MQPNVSASSVLLKAPSLNELPLDYQPFPKLDLCGNLLENVPVPFLVQGVCPLLIGRGPIPLVWLSARIRDEWRLMVQRSVSSIETVSIGVVGPGSLGNQDSYTPLGLSEQGPPANTFVIISIGGTLVLRAYSESADHAVVNALDLRPLGMNIHGSHSGLQVGSGSYVQNRMSGVRTAFNFS